MIPRSLPLSLVVALVSLLLSSARVFGDEHSHVYMDGEGVLLWASKVGPYHKSVTTLTRVATHTSGGLFCQSTSC